MSSSHKTSRCAQSVATVLLAIIISPFPGITQANRVMAQGQTPDSSSSPTSAAGRGADLSYASAVVKSRGVLIEWRSQAGQDNLGFNIYRLQDGRRARINGQVIAGAVFAGRHIAPQGDYSYSYFDPTGTPNSSYYIESVSVYGELQLHDAVSVSNKASSQQGSLASESLAASAAEPDDVSQTEFPATLAKAHSPTGALEDQWGVAAKPALKIQIKRDDWYRVTQAQMSAAGFNPTVDIANLSLFGDGLELAIRTSKPSGQLSAGDYIEFYGRGLDTATTDTRIYYLIAGTAAGKRLGSDFALQPGLRSESSAPQAPFSGPRLFSLLLQFLNGDERSKTSSTKPRAESSSTSTPFIGSQIGEIGGASPRAIIEPAPPVERQAEVVVPADAVLPKTETIMPNKTAAVTVLTPQTRAVPAKPAKRANRKLKKKKKNSHAAKPKYSHAVTSPLVAEPSFDYTLQVKERYRNDAVGFFPVYFGALLNGDTENYFGRVIATAPVVQKLIASNVQFSAAGPAKLEIALQGVPGVFFLSHAVNVEFNGSQIATLNFGPSAHPVLNINIPVTQLVNGANTVTFKKTSSGDVSLVDYLRLTYPHRFRADTTAKRLVAEINPRKNASLRFSLDSSQSATVDGFLAPSVLLLDISDPVNIKSSHPAVTQTGSTYQITVPTDPSSTGPRTLYALQEGRFETPPAFSLNQPSTLNAATNHTDLLILAHKSLIASAAPLVTLRQSQGMEASVVDIEDVYDEFSYGAHGPQAIKDFLLRAKTSWTKPDLTSGAPKYVIFLGDATLDPRSYEGLGDFDFVPTKLVDATYNETASDDWLTDFNNDGIGDIPTGRLPVRTPAEANVAISKIVGFSPTNAPQTALMVADDNTNPPYYFNFEAASDELVALLPATMNVLKVYRRTQPSICIARANIINAMTQGVAVVNYSGHGNVNIWAGSCPPGSMFETADAQALTNGNHLPLVIVTNCLNGYFQDPRLEGIAEGFIKAQNGGAVAVFASSGETIPDGQRDMSLRLYQLVYGSQPIALGDAIKDAKGFTTDIDVRRTWIFFGDPSMKIR